MSTRKEIDLSATWRVTLGSARVTGVVEPGPLHSSASPRSSIAVYPWFSSPPHGDVEGRARVGQSDFQCPERLHRGQGFVGGRGWGHDLAQWPSLPHLKHAPGGDRNPLFEAWR